MQCITRYASLDPLFISAGADAWNSLPFSLSWTSQPMDLVSCLPSVISHGFLSPTPSRRDTSPSSMLNLAKLELQSSLSSPSLGIGSSGVQTGRRMTSGMGATLRVGFFTWIEGLGLIRLPQISLTWKRSGELNSLLPVGGEGRGIPTTCSCSRCLSLGRFVDVTHSGDWLMALSWSLATGFDTPVTYFYPVYFFVLLVHRQLRDDVMCEVK